MELVAQALAEQGYAWLRNAVPVAQCQSLLAVLDKCVIEPGRGGVRQIHQKCPAVNELALQGVLAEMAQQIMAQQGLPHAAYLLRAIYFDKTSAQNWLVAWHQDLSVTAQQRFTAEAWGPWSQKDGVLHVQPPLAVLQSMLTLRLHLDAATANNGALKIWPRSHFRGIGRDQLQVPEDEVLLCEASIGDVLVMSPLLYHASSKAPAPSRRRILHFEYSNHACGQDLGWQLLEVDQ